MDECYREYEIVVSRSACWSAVIREVASGAMLPTKATALMREGRGVALQRARELIDVYADGEPARTRHDA